ncbi:hypothetical protein RV12_GL002208 [Enterococcus quebecensis]|nr:hypothetical protein RV12_GL002208 [Enterococcus quebecensis]
MAGIKGIFDLGEKYPYILVIALFVYFVQGQLVECGAG